MKDARARARTVMSGEDVPDLEVGRDDGAPAAATGVSAGASADEVAALGQVQNDLAATATSVSASGGARRRLRVCRRA